MKINLNIYSKSKFFKKIIILVLFMMCCFFIKENVFAESNYIIIPSRISEFNNYSTTGARISESLQNHPNTYLSQWFADLSYPYSYIVVFDTTSQVDDYERIDIYFFNDPVIADFHHYDDFKPNKYWLYLSTIANDYYKITITRPYNTSLRSISIEYILTDHEQPLSRYADESSVEKVYTNFDLYDENHNLLHSSDVNNFTLVSIPPDSGIGLKPKKNSEVISYFSYGDDVTDLYGVWYNIDLKKYENDDFKILGSTSQGSLTGELYYNSSYYGHYIYMVANRGNYSIDFYYLSEDFDLIIYEDFYSKGNDSNGNKYYNPFSDLNKKYDNQTQNIFDVIANIPKAIANFFSSAISDIGKFIGDLFSGVLDFFAAPGNFIVDLIIPDGDMLSDTLSSEYENMRVRLGFLFYPVDLATDFINRFYNIPDNQSAIITIPTVSFMNTTIVNGTTFNLQDIVNSNSIFTYLYQLYRVVVSGLIVLFVGKLAYQKFNETIGGNYK